MKNFTSLIVNMAKQENLFASQGGPIILAQVHEFFSNFFFQFSELDMSNIACKL